MTSELKSSMIFPDAGYLVPHCLKPSEEKFVGPFRAEFFVGTQKNRLNETFRLSTQNML